MKEHQLTVTITSNEDHAPGWLQHHVAQAMVQYVNANRDVDLVGGISVLWEGSRDLEIEAISRKPCFTKE